MVSMVAGLQTLLSHFLKEWLEPSIFFQIYWSPQEPNFLLLKCKDPLCVALDASYRQLIKCYYSFIKYELFNKMLCPVSISFHFFIDLLIKGL
ncbi:hypothetical protein GDO86_017021 [Hymenochirus boettgeri]|uniref:Uncharacterized protein n=1 Tax=Hymenochirus boettgeri TaxID=247094 RepID=A0A8T2INJ6_9PIPI|nr:hypothetical protein GDO86_017021 [Hymenochirus boettgeri]